MHQHGGDRPPALVEVSLDGHALSGHVRVGSQVKGCVGGQDNGLEQTVQAIMGDSRDIDELCLTAVLLRDQAELGELAANPNRISRGLVDLVDRDHYGHVGCLGVVEGLDGLRHHTVVGRDDQHRDIR